MQTFDRYRSCSVDVDALYAARTDRDGYIYADNTSENAFSIANAAIKAVRS